HTVVVETSKENIYRICAVRPPDSSSELIVMTEYWSSRSGRDGALAIGGGFGGAILMSLRTLAFPLVDGTALRTLAFPLLLLLVDGTGFFFIDKDSLGILLELAMLTLAMQLTNGCHFYYVLLPEVVGMRETAHVLWNR
ncbi:hypothetical protein PPYR_14838, partial [Photinus pyralis]